MDLANRRSLGREVGAVKNVLWAVGSGVLPPSKPWKPNRNDSNSY